MIAKLFDTGCACDGTMYTYMDNIINGHNKDQFVPYLFRIPYNVHSFLGEIKYELRICVINLCTHVGYSVSA